jgi:hypothetical protein
MAAGSRTDSRTRSGRVYVHDPLQPGKMAVATVGDRTRFQQEVDVSLSRKIRRAPLRAVTGAFILNSGLGKRSVDGETAAGLQGMAGGTYPFLKNVEPRTFATGLSTAEIALGSALLLPIVPTALAGLGLTAFAGGLVGLYLKTPGMTRDDGIRPTDQGVPIAKDVWMLGIGVALIVDALTSREPKV